MGCYELVKSKTDTVGVIFCVTFEQYLKYIGIQLLLNKGKLGIKIKSYS